MKNKKEIKPNNKKIILEVIIIPLCILYLYYTFFHHHHKINSFITSFITIVTCIEFIVLYIREVYVYKSKYNILKTIMTILSFLLIVFTILKVFVKVKIIKTISLVLIILFLIHLLYFVTKNIIRIIKGKGALYKNTFASFFGLISFVIILMGTIINF